MRKSCGNAAATLAAFAALLLPGGAAAATSPRLAEQLGAGAIVRFDPVTQDFTRIGLRANANVRQLLGRPGELWGAESGADRIVSVVR